MSAQETTVPESAYAKFNQMLAEQVASEPAKATGKEVVKRVVKKATDTVTKKIIIGVVTTALIAGTAFSILQKPDNDTPSDAPIEESTDTPVSFDEPLLDLDDKTQARLSVITEYYWKTTCKAPIVYSSVSYTRLSNESICKTRTIALSFFSKSFFCIYNHPKIFYSSSQPIFP